MRNCECGMSGVIPSLLRAGLSEAKHLNRENRPFAALRACERIETTPLSTAPKIRFRGFDFGRTLRKTPRSIFSQALSMTIRSYGSRKAVTTAIRDARMAGIHAPITPTTITEPNAQVRFVGVR